LLRSFIQGFSPGLRLLENFRNKLIFYVEELLAPRPTPKLEDHPLSVVGDCIFSIFATTHTIKYCREDIITLQHSVQKQLYYV
jgi:hypothetical protein